MIRDTLLVVDDSELDLAILNEIFKNMFQVECMPDAHKAMIYLRHNAHRVCAILLDICLERRGAGFTLLHHLQGHGSTACLPVIFITTDAQEKDVRAGLQRGVADFLVKPVNPHTVQERVCRVVHASWPPNTTILDAKPQEAQASTPEEAEPETVQFQERTIEETQALCRSWTQKLEAFCRLRPVLNMEHYRQLGSITTLLAQHYVQQFPSAKVGDEDARLMGLAAMLCDIGLLGLPDSVLEHGEDGEDADAELYRQHTQLGRDLFNWEGQDVPLLTYAAQIAYWHHKNVDGSGYPLEGSGDAIPLSAQLVRTALRVQHYLQYYRGCADIVERMLRALSAEVGIVLSPQLYQVVQASQNDLSSIL